MFYLYHGFWDTRYSWVTEGRLAQILDNLLAEGKALPMVVVVPEAHALAPEVVPVTSPDFGTTVTPYLIENQRAVDEELFHDIIPFVQTHYNISHKPQERAIAGLSMGGLQSIETGIVHLGYFCWIGAFSPGVLPAALSNEFRNALRDSNKINVNLLLFEIVTGGDDALVGKAVTEFEADLNQAAVKHVYTVVPGGTHSMFVWRPALYDFLQKVQGDFLSVSLPRPQGCLKARAILCSPFGRLKTHTRKYPNSSERCRQRSPKAEPRNQEQSFPETKHLRNWVMV